MYTKLIKANKKFKLSDILKRGENEAKRVMMQLSSSQQTPNIILRF